MWVVRVYLDSCDCWFLKQKTAYEVRISDWSSDVCSSDLADFHNLKTPPLAAGQFVLMTLSTLPHTVTGGDVRMAIRGLAPGESYMVTRNGADVQIGRASCRESAGR